MADDDGFIGLPPGILPVPVDPDSGTVKRDRPERTRTERDEIVFFPAPPGAPVVPPAEVLEAPEAEALQPPLTQPSPPLELDDATRASISRRHSAPVWRLIVPGHGPVPVEGVLFVGRNPVATPGHPGAHLLSVDDDAKSVSKTHAMLEVDAGGLWVHDLESTNGVWVVPAGADAIEAVPGERVPVPAGSDLEIGDLVIQVEHG